METLASSILEIRNSFLEKFKNEKLDIISKKLTELFDVENDPVKKIVLLASRVETIRKRIHQIHQAENKIEIILILLIGTLTLMLDQPDHPDHPDLQYSCAVLFFSSRLLNSI